MTAFPIHPLNKNEHIIIYKNIIIISQVPMTSLNNYSLVHMKPNHVFLNFHQSNGASCMDRSILINYKWMC